MQIAIQKHGEYFSLIRKHAGIAAEDDSTGPCTLLTGARLVKLPAAPSQANLLLSALRHFPAPTEIELKMLWKAAPRRLECFFIARSSLFAGSEAESIAATVIREYQNLAFSYPGADFELIRSEQINDLIHMVNGYSGLAEVRRRFIPMEEDEDAPGIPLEVTESPARSFFEGAVAEDQDAMLSIMVRLQPEGARKEIDRLAVDKNHWPGTSIPASTIESIREKSLIPLKMTNSYFEVDFLLAAIERITPNLLSRLSTFDANIIERADEPDIRRRIMKGGLRSQPEESILRTFSMEEAATALELPYAINLPGIRCGRVLTPLKITHDEGFVIGKAAVWGKLQNYRVPEEARARHFFICGASGTGKTTMLTNLTLEDLRDSRRPGVMVIDPHGDYITCKSQQLP